MKWAFFLGSATVGGGTYVIFEHATWAMELGEDVTIVTENPIDRKELYWHKKAQKLCFKTIEETKEEFYDVVISTWWRLVYEAYKVKGKKYIYFVQSIESRFYNESEKPLRQLAEATYLLPMDIITEATWIKKYLNEKYFKNAILVRNGIRKDIYIPNGECISKRVPGKLRVLVEGPVDVDFKNVPKTVELCKESNADEIWLLTSSKIKSYEGCDRVFSCVPITETQKIYRSCDVIVKLSYVEGMFGPPLEMFHCGGTAITYDVTGYDEYIENGVNALVAKKDDERKVVEYINTLKRDETLLKQLKENALCTAKKWISWENSSDLFYEAVYELNKNKLNNAQKELEVQSKFHFNSYIIAEDYYNEVKLLKSNSIKKKVIIRVKKLVPIPVKHFIKKLFKLI